MLVACVSALFSHRPVNAYTLPVLPIAVGDGPRGVADRERLQRHAGRRRGATSSPAHSVSNVIELRKKETMMSSTDGRATTDSGATRSLRRTALVAGVLYLITFVSAIPAVFLLQPVLTDPGYIVSAGGDTQVRLGALLDLMNALACLGTAVALFSIVKREHEGLALGFVTTRMFEATVIVIGVVCLLAVVTLREAGVAPADATTLMTVDRALVAIRNWTFLLGPSLMPAVNALLLGTLMYRSRLIPRAIPVLGLIGGPLLISSTLGTLLGVNDGMSVWTGIATAPIFLWELSLGLWMTIKGFDPAAPVARKTELQPAIA